MMVRLGIVATFLLLTLGSWALMKPPSAGVDRLANGALVLPEEAVAETVTRSAPAQALLPEAVLAGHDARLLAETRDAILDGLGFGQSAATPTELRDRTAGVLDGIGGITGLASEVRVTPLAELVIDGLRARTDDASMDALLNSAFASGEIQVPAALITTQGTVDSQTLLASIVVGARARMGEEIAPLTPEIATYTVREGDSLAGIAARLYGNVDAYPRLFEANDDLMATPAQISAGMLLVVPPA